MRTIHLAGVFFVLLACAEVEVPSEIVSLGEVTSNFVRERQVDVWLPPGYTESQKYPVIYMHDGQMLFDSITTWNRQEWGVDEVMLDLIENNQIPPAIVVGIHNVEPYRHANYFPQWPFETLPIETQDSLYVLERQPGTRLFAASVNSDLYLKFLVEELKPLVDSRFSTKSDSQNTFIMGSSMGGLISWYAVCEYPDIFGGAACLSTHWPGVFTAENNPIPDAFVSYLKKRLPAPDKHKFYFDYGTETLDALYEPFQLTVDSVMRSKGYQDGLWVTKKFEGHLHDERSWRSRLDIPLTFLLKQE